MENTTVFCFLASYTVACALEWWRLKRPADDRGGIIAWGVMLAFTAAGLFAQSIYLLQRHNQTTLPPLLSSSHDWLLVLTWIVVLWFLFTSIVDRTLALGLFLFPVVLAVTLSAYLVSDTTNLIVATSAALAQESTTTDAVRNWAMLHASLLVFGVTGVIVSFVLSLMYLVQHRRLKNRVAGGTGLKIPNLEKLARLNWWAVMIAVPLLTLGLATGVGLGWSQRDTDFVRFTDPVVLVNSGIWAMMFVVFLVLIRRDRPAARQVAILTAWACGFLLLTLIGLQILTGKSVMSLDTWHTMLPLRAVTEPAVLSDFFVEISPIPIRASA